MRRVSGDAPPVDAELAAAVRAVKAAQAPAGVVLESMFAELSKRNPKLSTVLTAFEVRRRAHARPSARANLKRCPQTGLDMWQLRVPKLADKKSEKLQVYAFQSSVQKALEGAADSTSVLELVVKSLLAQLHGVAVPFPPHWPHVPSLLPLLLPFLPPAASDLLTSFADHLATYAAASGEPTDVGVPEPPTLSRASSAEGLSRDVDAVRTLGLARYKAASKRTK